ncbi:MAG: hypothetical protein ACRD59_06840 [Candidatus Acidiferrales bacterium]
MKKFQRAAVLLDLVDELTARGSWCGETHLQKATYFLQELVGVPTGFDFILYKHGPFSFELRDELTSMRADDLLELRSQLPYGPTLVATGAGHQLMHEYPKTVAQHHRAVTFVADQLGDKNVADLERLATALFVTLEDHDRSEEERAEEISDLKPHIDREAAEIAVREVERIMEASEQI